MKSLKVVAIIFACITVLFSIGPLIRDLSLAVEIEDINSEGGIEAQLLKLTNMPSAGRMFMALLVSLVLTIGCIIGVIFAIRKSSKLAVCTYILFVVIVLTVVVHPSVSLGYGAATPREIAIFHAVPAFLTTLFLFLYARSLNKLNQPQL